MTESNRTQLSYGRESAWGVPATSLKTARITGAPIRFEMDSVESDELRADRQTTDLITVSARVTGSINFELSFGSYDDFFEEALFSTWVRTPQKVNVTQDSSITAVTNADDTFAVDAGGTSFKANHLIKTTGFTNAANNGLFTVQSSTGTTVVVAGTPTLVDESAPPAGAKIKVVGFIGASGDITAVASGLGSTTLDFTTLGLVVGQWIKIGGTASTDKFANAALNVWARITAITTNLIALDHKPAGWTTDAGTGKTIKVWFGDYLRNGSTKMSSTVQLGFLDQDPVNYITFAGLTPTTLSLNFEPRRPLVGSVGFLGLTASISETATDASPDAATSTEVMNAVSDVGLIAEGGSAVVAPNYIQRLSINVNNRLREDGGVGIFGIATVGVGRLQITGDFRTYFGTRAIYEKLVNSTATTIASVIGKNNQAYVFYLPKVKIRGGSPDIPGTDQPVLVNGELVALRDPTTDAMIQFDRLEYFE